MSEQSKKSLDTYSRRELTTRSWRRFELKVILPSFFCTNCARHVKYFLIHRNTARLINSRSRIHLEIPEIFLSRVSRKWMQFVRALQNFTLSATLLLPALKSAAFNFRIVYPQFFLFFASASAPRRGKFLDSGSEKKLVAPFLSGKFKRTYEISSKCLTPRIIEQLCWFRA